MTRINISQFDIARLLNEPSPTVRADVAAKLARDYAQGRYQTREAQLALDILQLLAKDPESRVRRVIAEKLKSIHTLPPDMALRFAGDVADVALPMLEYSYALGEDDLIEVVHSSNSPAKRSAIARRETISAPLADALIGVASERLIRQVCANSGAVLTEESIMKILGGFGYETGILEALAMRDDLPHAVAGLLFTRVRDELKTRLATQYKLPTRMASQEKGAMHEMTGLSVPPPPALEDADQMVEALHEAGELTDSLIIRALCDGNMSFFEAAMARRADVHPLNARMLMLEPAGRGFAALYDASGLPPGFYDAVRALYHVTLQETGYGRFSRADRKKRVLARLVREGHDQEVEHMVYLMSLIGMPEEAVAA